MTQNLAFEIGAAFFLAVLLIAGTMTRGLFPSGLFKNVKLTLGVATVMVGGYAAYRALPDVSSWWPFGQDAATAPASVAAPKEQVRRKAATRPVNPGPAPGPAMTLREVETPAPAVIEAADAAKDSPPVVVRNAATEPEPPGKGKKVLRSVGRFLHIVKKKDDDAKDSPQAP